MTNCEWFVYQYVLFKVTDEASNLTEQNFLPLWIQPTNETGSFQEIVIVA